MSNTGKIYTALAAIMSDVSAVGKTKRNQQQGFDYRGIDDVYNAIQPLFAKHGVVCAPEVLSIDRSEKTTKSGSVLTFSILKVAHHFIAGDGSTVTTAVVGEGMDSGDKATNKALAAAHKYAICQLFCIPTEDMPDPDRDASSQTDTFADTATVKKLIDLVNQTETDSAKFLAAAKADSFETIFASEAPRLTALLEKKLKSKAAK